MRLVTANFEGDARLKYLFEVVTQSRWASVAVRNGRVQVVQNVDHHLRIVLTPPPSFFMDNLS